MGGLTAAQRQQMGHTGFQSDADAGAIPRLPLGTPSWGRPVPQTPSSSAGQGGGDGVQLVLLLPGQDLHLLLLAQIGPILLLVQLRLSLCGGKGEEDVRQEARNAAPQGSPPAFCRGLDTQNLRADNTSLAQAIL